MDVEFVVVTYDSERVLGACLASIRRWVPTAIVTVVDNDSQDDSPNFARQLADRVLPLKDNHGYAGALNRAVEREGPEFLIVINPDLVLETGIEPLLWALRFGWHDASGPLLHDAVEIQYACARSLPSTLGLLVDQLGIARRWRRLLRIRDQELSTWDHRSGRAVAALSGAFLALRRSTWNAMGGMSTAGFMYFEDIDLFARLGNAGGTCHYVPSVSAFHVGGGSSGTAETEPMVRRLLGSWLLYADKYGSPALLSRWRILMCSGQLLRGGIRLLTGDPRSARRHCGRAGWALKVSLAALHDDAPIPRSSSPPTRR